MRVLTGSPAFLHAKPLGVDELVAGDDAKAEAGIVERRHAACNVGFESRDERLDVRRHGRIGLGGFRSCG